MVKRIVLGFVAGLLILAAGLLGALAGWAHLTFADGGVIAFDAGTLTPGPADTAVIIDVDRFGASIPYLDSLGTTLLSAHPAGSADATATVFLGAAATPDVDAYIKGTAYAVAISEQSGWELREIPGEAVPAPPADQGFWTAQAVGRTATISVPDTRPLTLVLMHPSAIPVGPVSLTIDFAVPGVSSWVLGLGIAAGVLLILGVVLLVLALRARRAPGRHEATVAAVDATAAATVEEPVAEAPVVEEPAVEESVTEESAVEESVTEESAAEEPVAEEPVAEDSDATAELTAIVAPEPAAEPGEPVQTELEVRPDDSAVDEPVVSTREDDDAPPVG